jgi:hypothetical protein
MLTIPMFMKSKLREVPKDDVAREYDEQKAAICSPRLNHVDD